MSLEFMENTIYYEKLVNDLTKAINQQKLVIFVGAGVSISQGYPNWNNYIEHLIKYWQGQVLAESSEKKLGREHHLIFDLISKSDITNKRKVDLVNYELKNVFGEDFEKRRLDFEKGYFKNLLPYSLINQTLESLASLNAIFITSNYDYEIENHARRLKNTVITINDLNEFKNSKKGKLKLGDVLHIHGTPDCDVKYFVSSSADYSKVYLRDRNNFDGLVSWFEETKPTVLFIGAGLEEDEILSLLREGSHNYALMKSEHTGNPKVDEHYKKIAEDFFNSENHTQIIWYGNEFSDLPNFIKKLVSSIDKKLGTHEFYKEWNNLLNPSLKQEDYNKSLDSICGDFKYLNSLLDKVIENNNDTLNELLLSGVLQGETIKAIESSSFSIFWKFIVKNIEKLSNNDWKSIYDIISKGNQSCFINDLYIIYKKAKEEKIFDSKQLNELRRIIAKDSNVINSSFNQDKTLLGYWFVDTFVQQNSYLYIEDESKIAINLVPECIERLTEIFNASSIFRYYTLKEILEHNNIELLYKLIKSKKLLVEGKEFLEGVPEKLLSTRLVQRLLVQIDNEDGLNLKLVTKLINNIDFSDIHFGEELNAFIHKHKRIIITENLEIPEEPYRNWISSMEGGFVSQFSFLTQENLVEYDGPKLLKVLVNAKNEQKGSSFLEEKTISETEDFLISVLKESNELSRKVSNLLENHIEDLYLKYKRLYVEIITTSEMEAELRNFVREKYLEKFNCESFDESDRKFFKYYITQQNDEELIFEKLLSIDVNKLSTLRDDNEQLDMFHYINSEMGLYLQCLISLFDNHSNYKPGIIQKIDSIEDPEYKELSQGILLNEYDPKTINVTYHTFLGFSYSHKVIYAKVANIFKGVVEDILKENIKDNQILDRVYLVALESVDPTIDSFSLSKNNFSQMINIIFTSEYEFRYSKQWLQELFKHDSTANYLETISNLFYRDNLNKDRLALFIKEFNDFISKYKYKLSLRMISYILKQEDSKKFDLIKNYFFVLLENDKLENDLFYLETIKNILPLLSLEERINVLQNIQKQKNCPPPEIEELQRIVNDLNS